MASRPRITSRISWTPELIEEKILKVSHELGGFMPTVKQLHLRNMNDLSCAIARHGGFFHWREKLNLLAQKSETETGRKTEALAHQLFLKHGYEVVKQSTRHKFDFLVNGYKVDIKSGRYSNQSNGHVFITRNLPPVSAGCDFFVLVKLYDDESPKAWFVIPEEIARVHSITLCNTGKYNSYENRFDLLARHS